jgi:hypothetical protein
MFIAALTSAFARYPHSVHRNTAWLSRFSDARCPQALHLCEV